MTAQYLFYLFFLLISWTVDLSHWEEWGELDQKYAAEIHEAVPRREHILGKCVRAVLSIAQRLLSLLKQVLQ
jgi:hypothetical protein